MNSQKSSPVSVSFLSGFSLRGILRAGSFNKALGLSSGPLFVDFTTESLAPRPTESAPSILSSSWTRHVCSLYIFWFEDQRKDKDAESPVPGVFFASEGFLRCLILSCSHLPHYLPLPGLCRLVQGFLWQGRKGAWGNEVTPRSAVESGCWKWTVALPPLG